MFKDRIFCYRNALPEVAGNNFVVPKHTHEGSHMPTISNVLTCIKIKAKSDYLEVKTRSVLTPKEYTASMMLEKIHRIPFTMLVPF